MLYNIINFIDYKIPTRSLKKDDEIKLGSMEPKLFRNKE